MAFDVKCPSCEKVYAAELRMAGKRIRCRQCSNVFTVELPDGEPAAVTPGPTASADSTIASLKGQAAGAKSVAGAVAPTAPARPKPVARTAPAIPARPSIRASTPQAFPMSDVVEAWLPLALGVIAAIWIPAETFSDNHSGAGWVPVLRIAAFVAFYLGLVVPLTLLAVKWNFRKLRKSLPPAPWQRVATTFVLPATLAYVFWLVSGGIGGFVTGLILGLALAAAAYWLLFRLEPQETANSYAIAAGTFFGSAVLSALLLMGLSAVLNRVMIASHYSGPLRESPLGEHFAWSDPAGDRKDAAQPGQRPTDAAPPETTAVVAAPPPQPEDGSGRSTGATPTPPAPGPTVAVNLSPTSANVPAAKIDNPDGDPSLRSELFGGTKADGDPFVTGIEDSKLPWVKWVFRPADEGVYEQNVAPLTPSPFTGLVRLSGISGKQIECCRLAPAYRGQGSVAIDDSTDVTASAGRFAITPDGTALLRLANVEPAKVEVVPFRGAGRSIVLTAPAGSGAATPYAAELLGALPGHRMLVRWSRAEQNTLQVYDYQSQSGTPSASIKLGSGDSPGMFAVSPAGDWFGIVEQERERSFLTLYSLSSAVKPPVLLPVSAATDKVQRTCAGIAFSPDGFKVAALLENGKDALVRSWTIADGQRSAEGSCKVPSADELIGQSRGRALDWITNGNWLVHGRTIIDASNGRVAGVLTNEAVSGQQLADESTVYLSYLGSDGHQHLAVVRFNPGMMKASPANGATVGAQSSSQ